VSVERAERAILDRAEAYRLVEEARQQRERAEKAEAERDHWRDLAVSHAVERDSLRRTLADLMGMHPARIVP
jgi:hypothetical protein